jgi:hypothetical protein
VWCSCSAAQIIASIGVGIWWDVGRDIENRLRKTARHTEHSTPRHATLTEACTAPAQGYRRPVLRSSSFKCSSTYIVHSTLLG